MPKVPRPGRKGVYIEFPERLLRLLDERADAERRARTTLVLMAVEELLGVTRADYDGSGKPPAGPRRPRREGQGE